MFKNVIEKFDQILISKYKNYQIDRLIIKENSLYY